jgi:hypothetical protein
LALPSELRLDNASSLVHIAWRPDLIEAVLINEVRSHFLARSHLYNVELGLDLFSEGRPDDPVVLDVGQFNPEDIGRRPSIVFEEVDSTEETKTIGGKQNSARTDGVKVTSTLCGGGNTIYCIHSTRGASRELGWEVRSFLTANRQRMAEYFRLLRLRVATIGKSGVLEENRESWVTTVSIRYWWWDEFAHRELAPLTKRFNMSTTDDTSGLVVR